MFIHIFERPTTRRTHPFIATVIAGGAITKHPHRRLWGSSSPTLNSTSSFSLFVLSGWSTTAQGLVRWRLRSLAEDFDKAPRVKIKRKTARIVTLRLSNKIQKKRGYGHDTLRKARLVWRSCKFRIIHHTSPLDLFARRFTQPNSFSSFPSITALLIVVDRLHGPAQINEWFRAFSHVRSLGRFSSNHQQSTFLLRVLQTQTHSAHRPKVGLAIDGLKGEGRKKSNCGCFLAWLSVYQAVFWFCFLFKPPDSTLGVLPHRSSLFF